QGRIIPGKTDGKFIVRFESQQCGECPFFRKKCRVRNFARVGPTLYVTQRALEVARRRQQLHPEDSPVRVVVESTIRSVKRAFPGGKLPVRGIVRARMMLYLAALMVNARRVHRYLSGKDTNNSRKSGLSLSFFKTNLYWGLKRVFRDFVQILPSFVFLPVIIPIY
ncbi:MAG: transposase, partial [Chloroflexota bacterium]|nr:transposase [Chloroflexota bacterium]